MANKEIAEQLTAIASRGDVPEDIRREASDAAEKLLRPIDYDLFIYRLVVVVLGTIALITVVGGIAITIILGDKSVNLPDAIVALGSAAVGALAGLLAPNRA